MLTPALTKRRKWSRKIPLRQLVAHREVLKQIISGWNNSREGNSSFLLYHNLIFLLRFSPSLSQWGFSHTFIPTISARCFFVTSEQQFSPAGQTPVLPCYLFGSFTILFCNLVWIFKVALMSCSQTAVTQSILMKLTEIEFLFFHWDSWPKNWLTGREVFQLWKLKYPDTPCISNLNLCNLLGELRWWLSLPSHKETRCGWITVCWTDDQVGWFLSSPRSIFPCWVDTSLKCIIFYCNFC